MGELVKTKRLLQVQIEADGTVSVQYETIITDDGAQIAQSVDGRVIDIGDDVSGEDELIRDIISGNLHTATRKKAKEDRLKAAKGDLSSTTT